MSGGAHAGAMRTRALPVILLLLLALPASPAAPESPPLATADDAVTAHFPGAPYPPTRLLVVAPSGERMMVEYVPFHPTTAPPVVARVTFDGRVTARAAHDPSIVIPEREFVVGGALVGARVDGTWTLVQPQANTPTGLQAVIRGKTWDDVMPQVPEGDAVGRTLYGGTRSEPIEGDGTGRLAADVATGAKAWNWHMQAAPRYDLGPLAAENLKSPEQDPRFAALR